jgi:DNA polymerase-3 subunit delta
VKGGDPVQAQLTRGGPGGVFYLHGEDEFRKAEAVRALIEAHLDPATRDFNLDRLRGRDVDTEQLASVLATPPMMAEWRVVVLRETEALAGSPKSRDVVLATAASPPPGLALILSCTVPQGSKAKFYGKLSAACRSMEFRALGPDDVPGWLMEQARESLGVEMEPAAAQALAQAVGTDLGVLNQELEKLSGYIREGAPITRADVEAAGTYLPVQDRWSWLDLVGRKRFSEALSGLRILMGQGESGVGLAIALSSHLLRIGVLAEKGPAALEQLLPYNQRWLARRLGDQARLWRPAELADALDGLRRLDRRLKSTGASDESLLQTWILERMAWNGS